jgi:hypothetical protein
MLDQDFIRSLSGQRKAKAQRAIAIAGLKPE